MGRRAWWATDHGVTESQTQLSDKLTAGDPHAQWRGDQRVSQGLLVYQPLGRAEWVSEIDTGLAW